MSSRDRQLAKAVGLAAKVHEGQFDKSGAPYILHPLRLMSRFTDRPAQIVAVLHDVVEDGGEHDVTLDTLRELGLDDTIVEAVNALTRRTSEGESYDAYVERAAANPIAIRVKLADLEDNLDTTRLSRLKAEDLERIAKYHSRRQRLLELIDAGFGS